MAEINVKALTQSLTPVLADNSRKLDVEDFNSALSNFDFGRSVTRGIRICYGATEGVQCIQKAFEQLVQQVPAEIFAEQVANAIQRFSERISAGGDNLTYAHFLLHGIQLPRLEDVIAKIDDNGRILHESEALQGSFREKFGEPRPVLTGSHALWLANGYTDDYHGLSLKLVSKNSGSLSDRMAKVGFMIDATNNTAVIINVQGRTKHRGEGDEYRVKDAKLGREYARLSHELGIDVRAFVIEKAIELFREWNLEKVLAIRPEHHVMHVAGHWNFIGRYDSILDAAGLRTVDGVYRTAVLADLRDSDRDTNNARMG